MAVCKTIFVTIIFHWFLLFLMVYLNKTLMVHFSTDDFPLLSRINPLFVACGQFFFSTLFLMPFCWKQFVQKIQVSIGGVILTVVPYVGTITSALTKKYFFNSPPYFQLRSFSLSCAFFIGFFNRHFYNFPDTIIAVSLMICGTLLASEPSSEFYFPFLVFGLASSVMSVQYSFGIRKAITFFRRNLILLAFSLNFVSFFVTFPFAFLYTDFTIFRSPQFQLLSFIVHLAFTGLIGALICLTSTIIVYFSSPLHYIAISTTRASIHAIYKAFVNPVQGLMSPLAFIGHCICVCSGVMAVLLQLEKLKQKAVVPWLFPHSIWRLLGLVE